MLINPHLTNKLARTLVLFEIKTESLCLEKTFKMLIILIITGALHLLLQLDNLIK
jgi:hypothetical protein